MAISFPYPIHPIATVATQIDQGEDPWFAIGCFLHDWWHYVKDRRQELIDEPPPPASTQDGYRWIAFCAATVEELCMRTSFPYPAWIYQPEYVLDDPWFFSTQISQHDWLQATTPEPFRRRNIFPGGSVLDNKYELQNIFGSKPRWSIWSDQDLQSLATADKASLTTSPQYE